VFLGKAAAPSATSPRRAFMDNNMHDLQARAVLQDGLTDNDFVQQPDGPIKTFTLRGIKDTPPYLHDGACRRWRTPWSSSTSCSSSSWTRRRRKRSWPTC
jgi:cytochrome c peroxidase